ncbi:MAG: pyrimidine dimer DNA glycosylase/endonuclease V [Candidatus Aenigmatarchaeota archaeon]
MRLWSLHPKYLDRAGLLAVWREGLLAKKVLIGETKGYKNHPQLIRFKNSDDPIKAINTYLLHIYLEANRRDYKFSRKKIENSFTDKKIFVTNGQLIYEFQHLKRKLRSRSPEKYREIKKIKSIETHPLFVLRSGGIEKWERVK